LLWCYSYNRGHWWKCEAGTFLRASCRTRSGGAFSPSSAAPKTALINATGAMDSSNHSTSRHRAALKQSNDIAHLSHSSSLDGSPNPFTSIAKPSHSGGARYPRSTQTVSVGWEEGEDTVSQGTSRLRIELAECVETKTVTTTTTTKRSYPPLLVHQRPLSRLDSKEYPLARKDTPPELAKLSFKFDGDHMDVREDFRHTFGREVRRFILCSKYLIEYSELTYSNTVFAY
jgi:hypothetical protein